MLVNQKTKNREPSFARIKVRDTGVIYDAIQAAQAREIRQCVRWYHRAEQHPSLRVLCNFWQEYHAEQPTLKATLPHVQLYNGHTSFYPLLVRGQPLSLNDTFIDTNAIANASVLFGEHFLVTFLVRQSKTPKLYRKEGTPMTVYGKAVFPETFDEKPWAWQLFKALHQFPMRYPALWEALELNHADEYDDETD